jgi:heptosyltransferase-2
VNRILVIRGGAIGDFVLTLPAIKLLRDANPRAQIEILGYTHIVALAENRFYADAVRSIEAGALASFFARDAEAPKDWAQYFSSFHLVVSYLFDPDRIFEKNVCRCGAENFLACFRKVDGAEHAGRRLARPLEELDLILSDPAARLYPAETDRAFAGKFQLANATIAIHPGSGSASKNWPLEYWLWLIERLLDKGEDSILVVGGEADQAQISALRAAFPDRLRFAENLSLINLAALLEQCAFFIGHDSGISHIAAAVGTRCLLLFGPSDPAVWAPANSNVRIVRAPRGRMADLQPTEVLAEIYRPVPTS